MADKPVSRRVFMGVCGRRIGIDLRSVESIEDAGDGEVHMHTSSDWYKIRDDFGVISVMWEQCGG